MYTADNSTNETQHSVFVLYCTRGNTSDSVFVLIHKNGVPGSITLTPESIVVPRTAGNYTFNADITDIASPTVRFFDYDGGTPTVTSATLQNSNTELYVVWGANNTGSRVRNEIAVSGDDSYG